ncbi:MAG: hypothetical protein IJ120_02145 [Solobacterium sp.]|nr:hypothetical protein [Solobacterium sp.]
MGMKANSGLFHGTNGHMKFTLDIQFFAAGKMPIEGRILYNMATNRNIKNVIIELYRPGAKVGNGSTAAAIKKEIRTGYLVGGRSHIRKGQERIRQLKKILDTQQLSVSDRIIANKLLKDLKKALGEK